MHDVPSAGAVVRSQDYKCVRFGAARGLRIAALLFGPRNCAKQNWVEPLFLAGLDWTSCTLGIASTTINQGSAFAEARSGSESSNPSRTRSSDFDAIAIAR